MSTRKNFDTEMTELKKELISMCRMAEEMIENSITAWKSGNKELAERTVAADQEIHAYEMEIENKCVKLLLRQQPVARDLLEVSAALKMITDIERIGDKARDISEIVYQYEGEKPQIVEQIYVMAEISRNMVHSSVRSFVENDMESAAETVKMDDKVDELFLHVKERLVELIYEDKSNADTALTLMLMAKYFERIADHAVNICEWVEFLNSGKRNRY